MLFSPSASRTLSEQERSDHLGTQLVEIHVSLDPQLNCFFCNLLSHFTTAILNTAVHSLLDSRSAFPGSGRGSIN